MVPIPPVALDAALGFRSEDFTKAKAGLSDLMTGVVHGHRPVEVKRHGGKERMLLVAQEELRALVAGSRFETRAIFDDGEVSLSLPQFTLIGAGATFDEAVEDALVLLRQYCTHFVERWSFYRETGRASLLPLVWKFALTPEDEQRDLLLAPPEGLA